jgi:hypothetical protein
MKAKAWIFVAAMVFLCGLAACKREASLSDRFFSGQRYIGFENLPEYLKAEDAQKEGCYVIVSSSDGGGELYGGKEAWTRFLEDSRAGKDAFLRIVQFLDEKAYVSDLLYLDDAYYFYDQESDDLRRHPYQYLRVLTGTAGMPEREITWYVLTDSMELTFKEAYRRFISSSMSEIEAIPPFEWLGFTFYLE